MALSNEDYKDVKREMGSSAAKKVSRVTHDHKWAKYQNMDKADLDAGRPLRYHTPAIKKEMAAKKNSIARKMDVKHSPDKMLFYRTLKNKDDYQKMHMKATPITPTGHHHLDKKKYD